MDTFARALLIADTILRDSPLEQWRKQRYASFDSGKGAEFEQRKLTSRRCAIWPLRPRTRDRQRKQEKYEQLLRCISNAVRRECSGRCAPPFVQNEPEKKMNKSNGYLIFRRWWLPWADCCSGTIR